MEKVNIGDVILQISIIIFITDIHVYISLTTSLINSNKNLNKKELEISSLQIREFNSILL